MSHKYFEHQSFKKSSFDRSLRISTYCVSSEIIKIEEKMKDRESDSKIDFNTVRVENSREDARRRETTVSDENSIDENSRTKSRETRRRKVEEKRAREFNFKFEESKATTRDRREDREKTEFEFKNETIANSITFLIVASKFSSTFSSRSSFIFCCSTSFASTFEESSNCCVSVRKLTSKKNKTLI